MPVNISDVLISNSEREFAIRSAPYLGISKEQALVNAKWQKIRKYKHYFHFGQSY